MAVGLLLILLFQGWAKKQKAQITFSSTYAFAFGLIFIMESSPLLGSPNLHKGEQIDIVHQLHPVFLFLVFGIFFHYSCFTSLRWQKFFYNAGLHFVIYW